MKVLMLSIAPSLLKRTDGKNEQLGEVVKRHRAYARYPGIGSLAIFVAAKGPYEAVEGPVLSVYPTLAGRFGSLISFIWMGIQLAQQKGFDLIVAQDAVALYAFILGFIFGKPVFVTVHGAWGDQEKHFKRFRKLYYAYLLPSLLRFAIGIRTVSFGVKEQLIARGVLPEKIEVIPTAVDVKKFSRIPKRSIFARDFKDHQVVLYTGRIEKEKNLLFLIEVARRVQKVRTDVVFLLTGDGSERNALETKAAELDLSATIRFLGHIENDQLRQYLAVAKVFVSPSISESLGTVFIEAGAAGLPVVTIRNLGSASIIEHARTGYLVERGDAQGFAEYILSLVHTPQKRLEMGARARERMLTLFDFKRSVEAVPATWLKAYRGREEK